MEQKQQRTNLTKEQKTGFVLLLIFAFLAIGLTFLQMRNTIYNPFAIHISKEDLKARDAFKFDETARLQQIDTDHDGLNDYEEINFYETSRYLPDTDSDGIDDKTEIDNGTDPLCPEGKTCKTVSTDIATSSESFVSPLLNKSDTAAEILVNSQLNSGGNQIQDISNINKLINDPKTLRQMLIATGQISEDDLKNISDEQLVLMAQQLAKDQYNNESKSNLEEQL